MKELRTILMILIVVALFTTLFSAWTGGMYEGYEDVDNTSYIGASQETMEQIEEMRDTLENKDTTTLGTAMFWISAPYRIALMMFSSVNIVQNLANDIAVVLHVPVVVIDAFVVIVAIIVMFGIIKIALRTTSGGY